MSEPVELRHPADLTLEVLEQIVWESRQVVLHSQLLEHISNSRAAMLDALADGRPVYGVNTGMGYLASTRLSDEEQQVHQANLLVGRAVAGPPFLTGAEARAVMVCRLACFLGGQAGVSPDLCRFLVACLNDGFIPAIPRTGAGSAGEIIPLAHAFGPLIGIGQVLDPDGNPQDAASALVQRDLAPYRLGIKDGVALIAGAPGAVALTAVHRRTTAVLFRQLLVTWACAIDALRAPLSPYDPLVARLANDSRMDEILIRLNELLRGSVQRSVTQAPVSFRVIPQVLAHLDRTLARVEEDVCRTLTAVTDSPVFAGGRFITSGGFHAMGLATDLDLLCLVLTQAAELGAQHVHRLLDRRFSGLNDQLARSPGPQAGLIAVHKRITGTINELRRLAVPASIGSADTSMGQEDAMTFTFEAAEKLRQIEELVRTVIACELLTCRQAWALRGEACCRGLECHVQELFDAVPPVDRDRPLGIDIGNLELLLANGRFQEMSNL